MKKTIILFVLVLAAVGLQAQSYITAGGIRLGTDWGLTVQQRLLNKWTAEGIVQSSFFRNEVLLTGMVQRHFRIINRHFNVYTGGGLHKGWNITPSENDFKHPVGITLVGGVELNVGRINLSYDFKPAVNLSGGEQVFYAQSGLSIRYILVKDKIFFKNSKKKKGKGGLFDRW